MSIYRRQRWLDPNGVHHAPATGTGATTRGAPSSASSTAAQDWSKHRKAQPAECLLPSSENWLDHLPPDVFPGALATCYPRIVNLIAERWNDRRACAACFVDLLVDRRGGRRGFPAPVKSDLTMLLHHWYRGGPKPQR